MPDEQTPRGLVEEVARAIYVRKHRGLQNCWSWDDGGLDVEHPGARDIYLSYAEAALAVIRARFERPAPEMIGAAVRAFYEGRRPMPDAIAAAAKVALGEGT